MSHAEKVHSAEGKHDLPTWLREKTNGSDGALWTSAYQGLEAQNHYHKGEGPVDAMTRLKHQGWLETLSIDDIGKSGHAKVNEELGRHGSLGGRNFYKSSDHVLNEEEQHREVERSVERTKEKERGKQAERLAPSIEKIRNAMTADVEASLKEHGLKTDPKEVRNGIVDAMRFDSMPLSAMQKRQDCDFPIIAGYVALGALSQEQRKQVLDEQQVKRNEWRAKNPEAEKGAEQEHFQTGELLREGFGKERIDAADRLLHELQPHRK